MKITRKLQNSETRQYFEDYLLCRNTQLVVFQKPLKNGKEKLVVVIWPTGFSSLPRAGGWDQQDYLTTRLFMAALRGEQRGVSREMAKN